MELEVENIIKLAELANTPIVVGLMVRDHVEGGGFGTAAEQARILDHLLKNFIALAREVADASRLQAKT